MSGAESTFPVLIWRGAADGAFRRYDVPRRARVGTVLDVVTHVQRHLDASLAYRYACRVGMCGSCAMTVNGKARWTCRTHVDTVAGDRMLEIGPLHHLPIVRDLVVDMAPFFDKWAAAKGEFRPTATRYDDFAKVAPASPARRAIDATIECIGCAVCYASCDVVGWKPDYLGPAALNRAFTLVNDVRDGAGVSRLRAVAGDGGCQSCHTHQSCTERCPNHLLPTASIAGLKRLVALAALQRQAVTSVAPPPGIEDASLRGVRHAAWRFVLQRASAAVLAVCVVVHLATIIYAARHQLTAAAIVAHMHASAFWPGFYTIFVVAVAIHAPLGLRAIADEWLGLRGRGADVVLALIALVLLGGGLYAVRSLTI